MPFLKQHRKATLEIEGRNLKGNFDVSLTNQGDRQVLVEMISECRKQLREFDPARKKRKAPAKAKAKKKAAAA